MFTRPDSSCRSHHLRTSAGRIDSTSRPNSKFISRADTCPLAGTIVPVTYGPTPSLTPRLWRSKL